MKTKSSKVARQSARKRVSKKANSALSTCPVGASGWCAYPFSVAQLQKRMKRIAEEGKSAHEMAGASAGAGK